MTTRNQKIAISMAALAAATQSVIQGVDSGNPLEVRTEIAPYSDAIKSAMVSSHAQALTRENMASLSRGIQLDGDLLDSDYAEVAAVAEEYLQDSTTGGADVYVTCYSNCHSACHGSRGWR